MNCFEIFGGLLAAIGILTGIAVGLFSHLGWWTVLTAIFGFFVGWFGGVGFAYVLIRLRSGNSKLKTKTKE